MNIVIAIIILLGYTIAMCIKGGGVPSSLSASVFDLPKGKRWIWTVVLYAVCFCVLVPFGSGGVSFLDKVSENTQFLAFIAIAALALGLILAASCVRVIRPAGDTLVLLRNYSLKDTALVLIARILLSAFFAGQAMSLIYSLAGGLASLMIMFLFNRLLNGHYIFLTSITGGIAHNLGQLLIAYLITRVPGVWMYLPFLIPGGMLTGLFTGLCAHFAQKYLMPVITRYLS